MSLREYILRRQATMRSTVETLRLETLPIVNTQTEDDVRASDFFGGGPDRERDDEELKAFRYDVATKTDLVDDWSLLDPDLDAQDLTTEAGSA